MRRGKQVPLNLFVERWGSLPLPRVGVSADPPDVGRMHISIAQSECLVLSHLVPAVSLYRFAFGGGSEEKRRTPASSLAVFRKPPDLKGRFRGSGGSGSDRLQPC